MLDEKDILISKQTAIINNKSSELRILKKKFSVSPFNKVNRGGETSSNKKSNYYIKTDRTYYSN